MYKRGCVVYYLVEFKTWIDTNKFSFMVGMVSRKFQEIHCRKLMKLVWRDLIPMMWANPVLVYSFTTSLLHQPYGRLKTHKSQLLWEIFKTQLNWTELNWSKTYSTWHWTVRSRQRRVYMTCSDQHVLNLFSISVASHCKSFDDTSSHFDTMPERDRQTNRQTVSLQHNPRYA